MDEIELVIVLVVVLELVNVTDEVGVEDGDNVIVGDDEGVQSNISSLLIMRLNLIAVF